MEDPQASIDRDKRLAESLHEEVFRLDIFITNLTRLRSAQRNKEKNDARDSRWHEMQNARTAPSRTGTDGVFHTSRTGFYGTSKMREWHLKGMKVSEDTEYADSQGIDPYAVIVYPSKVECIK